MEPVTPPVEPPSTPVSTVTDRRPIPRGVIPRGVQTWMLAGLALFMMVIMLVVGRPDAPARPAATQASPSAPAQSADRVRDYQERLRAAEARALAELQAAEQAPAAPPAGYYEPSQTPPPEDPIAADRRRREYESLFASNVVLSRRPDGQQPDQGQLGVPSNTDPRLATGEPSIDEIADAVVRATARTAGAVAPTTAGSPVAPGSTTTVATRGDQPTPQPTPRISAVGSLHRVLEGTVIDAVLTNRLDGTTAAPVNCLVTNPVFSHSGQHVLIPAGARVLGETRPVQTLGQTRLAVAFHRLLMPDGSTVPLDQFKGLNQIGDSGLRDRVNHHFLSTFGAAAAIGLVSGLSQWLGNAAFGIGDGDRTVVIAGSAADATAQASAQVMSRFLNRLPTITIREGHRVKVYITSDLDLPEWSPGSQVGRLERR